MLTCKASMRIVLFSIWQGSYLFCLHQVVEELCTPAWVQPVLLLLRACMSCQASLWVDSLSLHSMSPKQAGAELSHKAVAVAALTSASPSRS